MEPFNQERTQEVVENFFIDFLNAHKEDWGEPHHFTRTDLVEREVAGQILTNWGFGEQRLFSTWVGFGDEGGPSLLTAHIHYFDGVGTIKLITQYFDTDFTQIYPNDRGVAPQEV